MTDIGATAAGGVFGRRTAMLGPPQHPIAHSGAEPSSARVDKTSLRNWSQARVELVSQRRGWMELMFLRIVKAPRRGDAGTDYKLKNPV